MVATMPSTVDSKQSVPSSTSHSDTAIVCTICSAQYAPTQAHAYLLQAPHLALESAFMSMCHFCFRCRRPACPLCWDDVHGLCGACVEDVHLPFRQEAEPLPLNSQLLIPASPRPQQRHTPSFPLVAIQPGRFQSDMAQVEEPIVVIVPDAQLQQKEADVSAEEAVIPVAVQQEQHTPSIARRIERVLTFVLGLVLLIIAVLIVVASFSQLANEAILHLLHVDIRMEIEYLLQLIQQLRFGG